MESASLGAGREGTTNERTGEVGTKLRRAISPRVLTIFVIGDILGAGINALVGEVGAEVGGAIWTAFLAAFVLALFTAFAYAELVSKYPRAAGAALYTPLGLPHPLLHVHRGVRGDVLRHSLGEHPLPVPSPATTSASSSTCRSCSPRSPSS
jgi:hypothetical protein